MGDQTIIDRGDWMQDLINEQSPSPSGAEDRLARATREQLFDCARLLALSVIHHRAKFGVVPLRYSMSQLAAGSPGAGAAQVLGEALEMAQTLAAGASPVRSAAGPPKTLRAGGRLTENRRQLRINVAAPIRVRWSEGSQAVEATLENISWGGAAFQVPDIEGDVGDLLDIMLPNIRDRSITVQAKIIWIRDVQGGHSVATRFVSLSTADEPELEHVLEVLAQSGDIEGNRKYARLTQRIEIQFSDTEELQATLEDISLGGLGITLPEPLDVGQSFQAVISSLDGRQCELTLRARVVQQQPVRYGNREMYSVGLEFEHPPEELQAQLNGLIREMASARPVGIMANG